MFTYPVGQAVIIDGEITGSVLGPAFDNANYIVLLDHPTNATKAIIAHEDRMQLLTCHWCLDTQKVSSASFYGGQAENNCIPKEPCPYCTEKVGVNG